MIRVRKTDGTFTEITDPGAFVELVNDMDKTVMLVFMQVQPGAILQIVPGSSDAIRYEQLFGPQGVKFSTTMTMRQSK